MLLISLYDRDENAHTNPSVYATEAVAIRALRDAVANPESKISRHADAFELRILGTFDQVTGEIVPSPNGPQRLIQAHQLREPK